MVTDYFSKWVETEVEAYANIKDKNVSKFVWKIIICWFGIPQAIITDNGPQFDSVAFRTFCLKLKIKNLYFTPSISSKQWANGSNEQNHTIRAEENAGKSQRKMGGKVVRRPVGPLHNT